MTIHLTRQEINELCAPLKQPAAQTRFLEKVLGIRVTARRPDGLPLVGRTAADEVLNRKQSLTSTQKLFNWSK
jgi:hypothetical protein